MITLEINNDTISTALGRAVAALDDMHPIMEEIADLIRSRTEDRFGLGEAPDGSKWAANSPVTLARKKDPRPLFGRGNRLNNEFGREVGNTFAMITTVLPYAAMMQFGGTKAAFPHLWGNIPARPFFGFSARDESDILDIVSEALGSALTP